MEVEEGGEEAGEGEKEGRAFAEDRKLWKVEKEKERLNKFILQVFVVFAGFGRVLF